MKKRPFTASFDELMKNHYGNGRGESRRDISASADRLYARYYGDMAARCEKKKKGKQATALSLSYDDGETLRQQGDGEQFEEYVVQQSVSDGFEEYVVESAYGAEQYAEGQSYYSTQSSTGGKFDSIPNEDGNPAQECEVDIFPPPKKAHLPVARVTADRTPPAEPARQQQPQQHSDDGGLAALKEFAASQSGTSDDDFMADIQAILTGGKVYDKDSKQVKEKQGPQQSRQQSVGSNGGGDGPPLPEAKNEHDIFNRIAQSMQYANAYDLGTVELENRFADFDRTSEEEQRAAREKKARPRVKGTPSPSAPPSAAYVPEVPAVDSADFLQDLDAIHQKAADAATAVAEQVKVPTTLSMSLGEVSRLGPPDSGCMPLALSLSATSNPADYARPLFDTGEHVRTGWDLYTDQLRVGKSPGVLFSYGELISMGDFYQSASHMIGADVAELQGLKRLIQQSTNHYTGKGAADVKDDDWEKVTKFRYLELAEDNFHHFSPDYLFAGTVWGKAAVWKPNNKKTWEEHHRWAIEEAQKMFLDPANANSSFFPEWPLIINAFGDHFLTDAFASGHLVNKEAIIEYYKYNFNDGNSLKPEAKKFFDRVAERAWYGDVKAKISDLETYDGYIPVIDVGRPNIDSASRFASVLKGIAEQRPDQIGNLAIKALHDKLNKDGVEVVNDAGDGPWTLYGDGMLNDANLKIIQKAIQQSVDNVNDPTVYGSNLDFDKYYYKVWRFVPKMTAASQAKVKQLAKVYTSPDSADLVQAAADLIHKKIDILIKKLLDAKKLKRR
ncbi:MAG TPA: hypothetical protein VF297_08830 [Pyrinomonadaceae bacterium]